LTRRNRRSAQRKESCLKAAPQIQCLCAYQPRARWVTSRKHPLTGVNGTGCRHYDADQRTGRAQQILNSSGPSAHLFFANMLSEHPRNDIGKGIWFALMRYRPWKRIERQAANVILVRPHDWERFSFGAWILTQLHGLIATSWQRPWPTNWRGSLGAHCETSRTSTLASSNFNLLSGHQA
jgi:hypothetical protein